MNRKYLKQSSILTLIMLISILQTNCSQIGQQVSGFNLYSTAEEMRIGYEYSKQIEQQIALNKNADIIEYINDLGQRMVQVSKRSNIPFTFKVVDDPAVNAFAIPGGFCYVNTGLIRFAETEAELASVIGHEIGHVVGEHSMKRMSKARAINATLSLGSILGSIFIGEKTTENVLLVADLAGTGILLNYSRGDELEADRFGIQQMHDAGINPIGSQQFFEKLSSKDKEGPSEIEKLLSTHPATKDRVKQARKLINKLPEKTYSPVSNARFDLVKKLLPEIENNPIVN